MNPYAAIAVIGAAIAGAYLYSRRRVVPILTGANSEWASDPGALSPEPTTVGATTISSLTWRGNIVHAMNVLVGSVQTVEALRPGFSGYRATAVARIRAASLEPTATIRFLLLGAPPLGTNTRDTALNAASTAYNAARLALIASLDAPDMTVYAALPLEVAR